MDADDSSRPAPPFDTGEALSGPRTRRRGAALEEAILDAAWDEVVAVGYDRVTMASIAARAGTNKATLYRRWPNRTQLVTAAIDRRVVPLGAQPIDTGTLRGDVIAVLEAMIRSCHAARIVPDPGGDLATHLRHRAAAEGFEQMDLILRRARQRGETGAAQPSAHLAHLPVHVLHSELCLGTTSTPDQLATDIVDTFLPLLIDRPT